jgi:hypothetical protein
MAIVFSQKKNWITLGRNYDNILIILIFVWVTTD